MAVVDAGLEFTSDVADGGVAHIIDTAVEFTSGKLASIRNNGVEQAYIDIDGSYVVGSDPVVLESRTFTGGDGINTIGDLSADRTISVDLEASGGLQFTTGELGVDEANVDHDSLQNFVANEHVDHSGVTITAGSGLTGGGDITASRTLNVGSGDGISVAADAVAVDESFAFTWTGNHQWADDTQIQIGGAPDYWFVYDATGTQLRLRSSDVDGGGADGDLFTVADGGQVVDFASDISFSGLTGTPNFSTHDHSEGGLATIPNAGLTNSSVTVTAGTNLSDGGSVSLGGSVTINLADSIDLPGTLDVTGAVTLDSTLTLGANAAASGRIRLENGDVLAWRNAADDADVEALLVTGGDILNVGVDSTLLRLNVGTTGVETRVLGTLRATGSLIGTGAATLDTGANGSSFGGTLTVGGDITMSNGLATFNNNNRAVVINAPTAGSNTELYFQDDGSDRWRVGTTDNGTDLRIRDEGAGNTFLFEQAGHLTVPGDLTVSGAGPHAIGGAVSGVAAFKVHGAFTSSGASTAAAGVEFNHTLTGASGDTLFLAGQNFTTNITTQGNSETIGDVSQLRVDEPSITVGTGDTITNASTVKIASAPTEGTNNYALWVDAGTTRLDGNLVMGTNTADTGVIRLGNAAAGAIVARNAANDGNVEMIRVGSSDEVQIAASGSPTFVSVKQGIPVFINDDANANMTTGLTINQGAADDQAFALKSSDVTTGLTTATLQQDVETDDYFTVSKIGAASGGILMQSLRQDSGAVTFRLESYGGSANTTKTTSARAFVEMAAIQHDGANSLANTDADGNVFAIRTRVGGSEETRLLVDEDGDLYSVTAAQTFDAYDDLALVDAYDRTRAAGLRGEHTAWTRENERTLIELGVLGGPVDEGGMTNVTQMQRLLTGAVRQVGSRVADLETREERLESALREIVDENPELAGRDKALALLN